MEPYFRENSYENNVDEKFAPGVFCNKNNDNVINYGGCR